MNRQDKILVLLCTILGLTLSYSASQLAYNKFPLIKRNHNSMECSLSGIDFSNATVISDGYLGVYWNNDNSDWQDIAIDSSGVIHVIWEDDTDGVWGWDSEVMYVNYTQGQGWSNVTVISDGYLGVYWNDRYSMEPKIAIDNDDNLHVVWYDSSTGPWGTDEYEIMYVNRIQGHGWSNVSVISDGYLGVYWNDGYNFEPSIAIDNNNIIHVVWQCGTEGAWGTDSEIMYVNYTQGHGWSNVTVISDGYLGVYWNDGSSIDPSIATDNNGNIHVVWYDSTDGVWGTDGEIWYANYTQGYGWSNASVISDGYLGVYWNDNISFGQDIVIDDFNNIHVVWHDDTDGVWGTDLEIMYVNYIQGQGWSNISVISDGYLGTYWNDGVSVDPSFVVDSNGDLHLVWADDTDGEWGSDREIMYATYIQGYGWSNASVISDGYLGTYWNNGSSSIPVIDIDNYNNLHIIWNDDTDGVWGTDSEIMYINISIHRNPGPFILSSDVDTIDTDGNFILSWTRSPKANNYSIYRHSSYITEINKSLTILEEEIDVISLHLSGYSNGTYYFIVAAFNNFGNITSNWINVTVGIPPPKPPRLFELSSNAGNPDNDGNFNLTWTGSIGANNYSIYQYSSYIIQINESLTLLAEETELNSLPLTSYPNGTYYFIVVAFNKYGNRSSNCIQISVEIPSGEPEPVNNDFGELITGYSLIFIISAIMITSVIIVYKRLKFK